MEQGHIRNPQGWEWSVVSLFNMISAYPDLSQIDETMAELYAPLL